MYTATCTARLSSVKANCLVIKLLKVGLLTYSMCIYSIIIMLQELILYVLKCVFCMWYERMHGGC